MPNPATAVVGPTQVLPARPPAQACDAPRLPPAPVTPVAPKHSGRLLFNPSSPPSRDGDDLAFLLLEPSYDAGMRRWRPTTQPTRLLPPGWLYASSGRCPVDVPAGRHGPAVQLRARRADPLGVMYDSRKFRGTYFVVLHMPGTETKHTHAPPLAGRSAPCCRLHPPPV